MMMTCNTRVTTLSVNMHCAENKCGMRMVCGSNKNEQSKKKSTKLEIESCKLKTKNNPTPDQHTNTPGPTTHPNTQPPTNTQHPTPRHPKNLFVFKTQNYHKQQKTKNMKQEKQNNNKKKKVKSKTKRAKHEKLEKCSNIDTYISKKW